MVQTENTRMRVELSKNFIKQYDKASVKIKEATDQRISLFQVNPSDPQLRNHKLSGKYSDCSSINITGDWRALYKKDDGVIHFLILGTHSELYG